MNGLNEKELSSSYPSMMRMSVVPVLQPPLLSLPPIAAEPPPPTAPSLPQLKLLYSLPVAEPSLLVSVFSLEEKGKGRENSDPWSGGQPAIMQRRSRPHLRINGHRASRLHC